MQPEHSTPQYTITNRWSWTWIATILTFCGSCACTNPQPEAINTSHARENTCPRALPAPHILPGSRPEHRDPGFWLSRLEDPDRLLLSPDEISELNRRVHGLARERAGLGGRYELLNEVTQVAPIISRMHEALEHHQKRAGNGDRVFLNGDRPPPEFFQSLAEIQRSGEPVSSYHLIHQLTELRCHPSREGIYEFAGDVDFDLLLCSTLRPGEIVRLVSTHREGWNLVRSAYAAGWVHDDDLGSELSAEVVRDFLESSSFVVVTRDRATVWRSPRQQKQLATVRVGLRLPLIRNETDRQVRVLAPSSEGLVEGFINRSDVQEGYLPFTWRNVIIHAFERLDDVFGWAGAGGDRDCSRFLMDLFALFGLQLPRNSFFQSQSASFVIDTSEITSPIARRQALDQALERGIPLVFMPGHIMLLLGRDGDEYHAIHQFSGYRVGCAPDQDIKMVVDRLAVTTLSLGEGSSRRAFMDRFTALAVFGRPEG